MSPRPEPAATRLSRRVVLVGSTATVVVASGCTLGGRPERDGRSGTDASPPEPPQEDPDVSVATEALAAVEAALALAVATGSRHPALTTALADTVAVHERHGALLVDAVPGAARFRPSESPNESPNESPSGSPDESPSGSPNESPSGSPSGSSGAGPSPDVPRSPRRALDRLVGQERALVVEGKRLAFAAQSGAFARVLGSLAASAAQQASVLSALETPRERSRR